VTSREIDPFEVFTPMAKDWNPHYIAYCVAQGINNPIKMLKLDRKRWPGGVMCGFSLWIGSMWNEWYVSIGKGHLAIHDRRFYQDHAAFDRWLRDKVRMETVRGEKGPSK
jgi:hypothetical protein